MSDTNEVTRENPPAANEDDGTKAQQTQEAPSGDEFQLTIRKLEMPVRPRGVLAE